MKGHEKLGTLLGRYLREHRKMALILLVMAATFFLVVHLYGYPAETVLYATALSLCIGLLAATVDFISYRQKYLSLHRLAASICLSLDGLPSTKQLTDQAYQSLITLLYQEKQAMQLETDRSMSDMMDYFTLWAHQIKTPISAMLLLLQSQDSGNEPLGAELFKVEQYVEMVLCYMRLESRDTDYVLQEYALDPIIRQALRKYSRLFIQKGIPLDFQETQATVLTDEKWLGFVIEQLLSNAVKYTSKGCISISMEHGQLLIRDTGMGIPGSDLPRIFDKGFTGYNGRIEKKSTGLGLYLCKRVLSHLSHDIAVVSKPGIGTRVRITFPEA